MIIVGLTNKRLKVAIYLIFFKTVILDVLADLFKIYITINVDSERLTAQNERTDVDYKDVKTTYFSIELFRRRTQCQDRRLMGVGIKMSNPHPSLLNEESI